MSRVLQATGNRVMHDHSAWFLRIIKSSLRALCHLLLVKEQNDVHVYCRDNFRFCSMYNKTVIIRFGFLISRIINIFGIILYLHCSSERSTQVADRISLQASTNCIIRLRYYFCKPITLWHELQLSICMITYMLNFSWNIHKRLPEFML